MAEITRERWAELNARLEAEIDAAQSRHNGARRRAARVVAVFLASLFAPVALAAAGYLALPANVPELAALGVIAPVFCAYFMIRASRMAGLERAELERVQHDHRQWKRRRPKDAA